MPTRLDTNFAPLTNPDRFESMIRDICALEWNDPHTEKFGRKGQKQYGVDVYGQPADLDGGYRAAQCKLRTKNQNLTKQEIEREVNEAKEFPHALDSIIIVTDGPRDTHTQIIVDQINARQVDNDSFRVVIWFWDNVTERLATYPKLIVKYYSDYFANLTTLPTVERLVDSPLQIVSIAYPPSGEVTPLEESLQFRGLRILKPGRVMTDLQIFSLNDTLPEGLTCQYDIPLSRSNDTDILKFASKVRTHEQQVEIACPIFVVLPQQLTREFLKQYEALGSDIERVQILTTDDRDLNEIANRIFRSTFDYGYRRRGSLATIDIAARTLESKPRAALLDLDWQTKLSTTHFPTPEEWEDKFIPALTTVKNQIVGIGDKTRIQINCKLPLPAAFALGFFFNLRVARVGVWARGTGVSDFKKQFWLSDGEAADVAYVPKWIKQPVDDSRSIIIELTSHVDIHKAVESFVRESGIVTEAWLQVRLDDDGKSVANIDEGYAVAYAGQVGGIIRQLNSIGITDIHLFARIPSALAVLTGQRLQACGRIHLYWFDNPTYRFAFTLR
jgi:hypothetical protein